jgi:S-formylglutathione hydrolase FrmB
VIAPTAIIAAPLLVGHHTSLMHGWVPLTVQGAAAVLLVVAARRRSRRWRRVWLPVAAAIGVAVACWVYWIVADGGLTDDPAPNMLWIWVALTGASGSVLLLGWRAAPWRRRSVSVLAFCLCVLSSGLALNGWVGYFPTVQSAWNQLTGGPLPDQTDVGSVTAMIAKGAPPRRGSVVPVSIPADASHFKHRGELVYLPPAWFAQPRPQLPTVIMIGGEFNTPADWLRAGNAVKTADTFAAAHGGNAPVLVFADSGGAFSNDTECVNGPRGKAADHLTKDVVPFMVSRFGVSPARDNWGIVGWSMGGTCAVDLTVMHPELFSSFVDIDGDLSPNSGSKAQTIARLFGGDANLWAQYDPTTVMTRHGRYHGVSGWFAVNSVAVPAPHRNIAVAEALTPGSAGEAPAGPAAAAADVLCAVGRAHGIDCEVITQPGRHDWPFAGQVFATALPWLAGRLSTPAVPRISLPGAAQASR